jgi:hypothetical protein
MGVYLSLIVAFLSACSGTGVNPMQGDISEEAKEEIVKVGNPAEPLPEETGLSISKYFTDNSNWKAMAGEEPACVMKFDMDANTVVVANKEKPDGVNYGLVVTNDKALSTVPDAGVKIAAKVDGDKVVIDGDCSAQFTGEVFSIITEEQMLAIMKLFHLADKAQDALGTEAEAVKPETPQDKMNEAMGDKKTSDLLQGYDATPTPPATKPQPRGAK